MNILLTNDDGITAPGLWAAARALAPLGSVLVVAPSTNWSGYGAALPPASELGFAPFTVSNDLQERVTAFSVDGTPAACAQVGLSGALSMQSIDLVVSGINAGLNVGRDVFYSGTVGAAITARLMGKPAIAVSLDNGSNGVRHFETAAACLADALLEFAGRLLADPAVINLNVPNLPLAQLGGVKVTTLSAWSCANAYQIEIAGTDSLQLHRIYQGNGTGHVPGTDAWAVANGYLSVTWLRLFQDLLRIDPLLDARRNATAPWFFGDRTASLPQVSHAFDPAFDYHD
ncbi:MAG: 5'/3'-nucleotidase SurE [Anaerolineales bacterium]|nr:5'/3'-nucleotidase SurE [Anaerolineales bacterium]MCO5243418.1 5'/3'-nucleotidase SurE [Anaerolineae bacterium]